MSNNLLDENTSYENFISRLSKARNDLDVSLITELLLDQNEYYTKYPDVEASNIPAIKHYVLYGQYEERHIAISPISPDTINNIHERNLYLSDENIKSITIQGEKDGGYIVCNSTSDFTNIVESIFSCKKLIYCASIETKAVQYAIQLAKKIGVQTLSKNENDNARKVANNKIENPVINKAEIEFNKFLIKLYKARPELKKDFIISLLIDGEQYYKNYPDVRSIKMTAAKHYFSYGYKEKRNLPIPKFIPYNKNKKNSSEKRYLYFSNAPIRDGSFQYRCVFQAKKHSNSLVYNSTADIKKVILALFLSDTLIFSRPEIDSVSFYVIQLAKRIGVTVEFDFDDLLLPEYSDYLGHVRSKFSPPEAANTSIITKLPYLYLADAFRCTTPLIQSHLSKLEKPVSIHQNKLPRYMANLESDVIEKLKDIKERKVNLIYLSGTATHKKDYSVVHGVLIKLAQQFPTKFTITFLGNTQQNIAPFKLLLGEDNVKEIARVNFQEMLDIIALHDVGLVPLEKTIFNNAKSNIKFIECGSQGTPVIATDADEFKSSIVNNESGWLCSSQSEWFDTLSGIVNQKINILPVSLNAKKQVEKEFMIGGKL
jgi:glycosyltransferase involved in cell wall biosynthesis